MLASVTAWPRVRVWGGGHTPSWLRRCEPLSPLVCGGSGSPWGGHGAWQGSGDVFTVWVGGNRPEGMMTEAFRFQRGWTGQGVSWEGRKLRPLLQRGGTVGSLSPTPPRYSLSRARIFLKELKSPPVSTLPPPAAALWRLLESSQDVPPV